MQMQLEKAQPVHGVELGPDCLCPPVCFQCPPPFCLPCGPGPGGAAPDNAGDCMPPPRQCGPFMMLNTPMERKIVMLPMMENGSRNGSRHGRHHDHDDYHGHHRHHRDHRDVDCCDKPHHHHHGGDDDPECCDLPHHHHHHDGESEEKCKRRDKDDRHLDRSDKRKRDERDSSRSRKARHGSDDDDEGDTRAERKNKEVKNDQECEGRRDRKRASVKSPRTNSRELRGGKLYIGCACEKRNGLQDECQRSLCQGSPECTTIPPTCAPSEFSNGKHLAKRRSEFEKRLREKFKYC